MIRPMHQTDAPEVLALLEWMDDQPEREALAPEARALQDLVWESQEKLCLVDVDDGGQVRAYCALARAPEGTISAGQVLEGPLGTETMTPGALAGVVRRVLQHADGTVYAFCARDNESVRDALEAAGFSSMHATDFYRVRRTETRVSPALPAGLTVSYRVDFRTYRSLYRSSEDVWSSRLSWERADFEAHLRRDDVRLLVLSCGDLVVGFAELELGETAGLTYLAVHPAERGRGYGRVLLQEAVREAFARPEVRELRARAHDHESRARALYHRAGFNHCRSIVTYVWESAATSLGPLGK